jgi:hypothetical protein
MSRCASCRRWRGFQLIDIDPRHESPFTRPSRYLLPFLVQGAVCLKRHARGNIVGVIQAAETGAASSPVLASAHQLGMQAETLRVDVGKFLANIRAA